MYNDLKIGETVFPFYVKLDVFKYIDAFVLPTLRETALDGLVHIQQKHKVRIHGWIVLPSAVKIILSTTIPDQNIEHVIDSLMSFTDHKLMDDIQSMRNEIKKRWMLQAFDTAYRNKNIMFWHLRYTLEPLDTEEAFMNCLRDIHEAPVITGLVWDAPNYMYSSAIDYIQKEAGLLPVVKLKTTEDFF